MTAPPDAPVYAQRALRAYQAMRAAFAARRGYRRDGPRGRFGAAAHLWPLSRALVGTLDVMGMPEALRPGWDADAAVADHLAALEAYWLPAVGAYSSDVVGTRLGGDVYYDDNAWVGLGLVELHRLRLGSGVLERAAQLYRFAAAGWDARSGGVFWVRQGTGLGARNHDRNAVSTAPNAELGLHAAELGATAVRDAPVRPREMYDWVRATLDAGRLEGRPEQGLFLDKVRGDGTVDRTVWSYNQGSMAGASILLARQAPPEQAQADRARGVAIARTALAHFGEEQLRRQPPAFVAILFRNLLLVDDAVRNGALRDAILTAMRRYAEWAWESRRDDRDRFDLPDGGVTLLNQSAMVQILALLAWEPADYGRLA